jgi:hypothetical protein
VQNTGNLVDARFLLASELVFRLHHMCMIASDTSGQAVQGHPLLDKVYQGIIESQMSWRSTWPGTASTLVTYELDVSVCLCRRSPVKTFCMRCHLRCAALYAPLAAATAEADRYSA